MELRNKPPRPLGGRWMPTALIGRGKYGEVYGSVDQQTGKEVAVKLISKEQTSGQVALKEVQTLQKMSHPNVVGLLEVGEEDSCYFIVMELCRGDLFDRIELCGWFDEEEALHYMTQLAAGVAACHAAGVAHRDIKPENLLLDSQDVLKITDFGLAAAFEQHEQQLCSTPCGSPKYAAPQVLLGQPYSPQAADVWSMGITLFVMTMGAFPFHMANANECNEFRSFLSTARLQFPERGTPELEACLHCMLAVDEAGRPTAAQLHRIWSQGQWCNPLPAAPAPQPEQEGERSVAKGPEHLWEMALDQQAQALSFQGNATAPTLLQSKRSSQLKPSSNRSKPFLEEDDEHPGSLFASRAHQEERVLVRAERKEAASVGKARALRGAPAPAVAREQRLEAPPAPVGRVPVLEAAPARFRCGVRRAEGRRGAMGVRRLSPEDTRGACCNHGNQEHQERHCAGLRALCEVSLGGERKSKGFQYKLPSQVAVIRLTSEREQALQLVAQAAQGVCMMDPGAHLEAVHTAEHTLELRGMLQGARVVLGAESLACDDQDGCRTVVVLSRVSGDLIAHRTLLLSINSNIAVVSAAPRC